MVGKKKQAPRRVIYNPVPPKPVLQEEEDVEIYDYNTDTTGSSRYGLWVVALASIAFLIFSFSYLFSGATVNINPRVEELVLNQNFTAVKDGTAEALPFELVVISGEENKGVEGGEAQSVSRSAEGTVVIYNEFSIAPQRLDINTRLEGSNGKMYKTKNAVTVPGKKGNTAGSVEVGVYASETGEGSNSGPLEFKIFGFKGTPRYSKFYAKSNGGIEGGFVGTQRVISEADKTATLAELKTALQTKLLNRAVEQIPDGFVLFEDAAFLHIDEENFNSTTESSLVNVNVKGTLYGILFEEKVLTKKIIESSFKGEEENDIYIQNIKDLNFAIATSVVNFESLSSVSFKLTGTSKAVWRIDEPKLLADIVGKKKRDFNVILSQYPNVVSASLSLRPFWNRSLPDKGDDIKIIVNYPQ